MAATGWNSNTAVSDSMQSQAQHYNVNQLIKLLLRNGDSSKDVCDQLDDVFYFQSEIRYAQPEAQVTRLQKSSSRTADDKLRLITNHFGMAAYNGPMPDPFLDWIFRELNDGYRTQEQSALLDFIDIFNHRFLAIQHQNRAEQRLSLQSIQPNLSSVAKHVESLAGFDNAQSFDQVDIDEALADDNNDKNNARLAERRLIQAFAGLLYNPRKSANFVQAFIASVFSCPVDVQQFCGQWLTLEQEEVTQLRRENTELGVNTLVGKKIWDQQGKLKITLGPLSYHQLCSLLEDGSQYSALVSVIRFASDGQWDAQIVLTAKLDDLPVSTLSNAPNSDDNYGFRLGRNSWLKSSSQISSLRRSSHTRNQEPDKFRVSGQKLGQTSTLRYPQKRWVSTQFSVGV